MFTQKALPPVLEFHPLTPERWKDLEVLFGERGACGGCWCMWWRLKRSQFEKQKGQENKKNFRKIVNSGEIPGILAYADGQPIAWCSIAPRETYSVLERSRILKRIDDESVWSVVCFFVARPFRRRGITVKLLKAAVKYARECKAKIVEGYPIEPKENQHARCLCFYWFGSYFSQDRICRSAPSVRDSTYNEVLYQRRVGGI